MKRITTIAVACFAVALSGAAMAIASSGSGRDHPEDSTTSTTGTTTTPSSNRPRHLDGRVVAIDTGAKTFDLRVRRHRHRSTVTITVTDATVYKRLAGFASLKTGLRVKTNVRKADGVVTATKVVLKHGQRRADDNADHDAGDDHGVDGANHDAGDDHGGNSGRGGGDDH